MSDKIPMSAEGLKKLQEKLRQLTDEKRPAVEQRLGEARDMGDLSENSEFHYAREEMWRIDNEISNLQDQVNRADIVSSKNVNRDQVSFGARVKVRDMDAKIEEEYCLVSEGESNPMENRIAITTPIGQGLMNHKAGETVKIKVPAGILTYQILEITYDS